MPYAQNFNTYNAMLLGAQAAGIAVSIYGERQGQKIRKLGYELDKGELGLRMQEEELAFTQANIQNLENLRENLATQNAIMGARGQMGGVGSALAAQNKSISNFNADTEALRMNKAFRQSQYKALGSLQGMRLATGKQESANRILGQSLNMFSLSESLYQKRQPGTKQPLLKGTVPTNYISKSSGNR